MVTIQHSIHIGQWTLSGQQRIAWAIRATLQWNKRNKVEPASLRQLSRRIGDPTHSTLGSYYRAVVTSPGDNGIQLLRAIAPYIYRVKRFEVAALDGDLNRLRRTVHEQPDLGLDVSPWEQGCTYGRDEFLQLGGDSGSGLEFLAVDDKDLVLPPEAGWLFNAVRSLPDYRFQLVAEALRVSPQTLALITNGVTTDIEMDKFQNFSQALDDFLLRKTTQKTNVWQLRTICEVEPGLTEDRLLSIRDEGAVPTPTEITRLASLFRRYGVDWSESELTILASRQYPTLPPARPTAPSKKDEPNGANHSAPV